MIANAGAAGTRAYALALPQSLMEYFLVAVVSPDAGTATPGGYVGSCEAANLCVDYYKSGSGTPTVADLAQNCSGYGVGTWRTGPVCSGAWCGTCTLPPNAVSYATHYMTCTADLPSSCSAQGGTFTNP